ncbi:helix-turn-helix domain-containing protein [Herbaspirillum sp. 3R11]|nr:helix-turn-helix domain-containing protein [Herbaspirillum sp. 3R-3a1]TFI05741.1 helix-turn-helix domain-containing protein [Herbaspirillum sp. 3R11]TFI13348.1 helix-turn-helix domain-containing protein [Herbaspirillum sp. 3R-11]
MSDQQGNEAPISDFASGTEEVRQVALPGALLAAQRQAKGWSVEHAAGQLKFATRQVIALESDNYAALPGPVIVRGFVRAYAKLLGLDANALVALLPQDGPAQTGTIVPQRTLSTPFSESPLPLGNRSKVSPGLVVGGVLVVLLIGAAAVIHRTDAFNDVPQLAWLKPGAKTTSDEPAVAPAQAQADAQQDLPAEVQDGSDKSKLEKVESAVTSAASSAGSAITTVSERVASAVAPSAPEPAAVKTPAAEPAQPKAAAALVNPGSPVTGSLNISNSKDLLRLTFREDSWVEIRRGDKSTMISRLLKAGTTESFDINEPVTLVVGNAAGVDASLRGSRLDLETGSSSNVARLSLK